MPYLVLFENNPEAPTDLRRRHMAAHLDFLAANAASISAAGPLATAEGVGAGGGWVVEAESAGEVAALIEADPFRHTGLRRGWRILRWTQVFADGRRLV